MIEEDDDDDTEWLDDCFALIRMITAFVIEYTPHITEKSSPAGWTLTDLRSINEELLQAAMNYNKKLAISLDREARTFIAALIRLVG